MEAGERQLGVGDQLGAGARRLGERGQAAPEVVFGVGAGVLLDEGDAHG
jgi:hypothetical protein